MDAEKIAENKLIAQLERLGLKADHVETGVDGFPDIFVSGEQVALVEMKACRIYDFLKDVMESSQPVFMYNVQRSGNKRVYLCVWDGEKFYLYGTHAILPITMNGGRVYDLPLVADGQAPEIAETIRGICNG